MALNWNRGGPKFNQKLRFHKLALNNTEKHTELREWAHDLSCVVQWNGVWKFKFFCWDQTEGVKLEMALACGFVVVMKAPIPRPVESYAVKVAAFLYWPTLNFWNLNLSILREEWKNTRVGVQRSYSAPGSHTRGLGIYVVIAFPTKNNKNWLILFTPTKTLTNFINEITVLSLTNFVYFNYFL